MDFAAAADRAHKSVVGMYLKTRSTGRIDIASGALVSLGGLPFIITAGHNLLDYAAADVFLLFPTLLILPGIGGRSILRLRASENPDVGVIELDPGDAVYWHHLHPLDERSFIDPEDIGPEDTLVLSGFPAAKTQVDALSSHEDPATPPLFRSAGIGIRATLAPDVRSPHEPPEGRGVQVVYHGDQFFDVDTKEGVTLPPPEGISGGPLLAVSLTTVRLLGLARSVHGSDARYEWCEPAHEALRLLVDHPKESVVEAVDRILSARARKQ
ncbi:MULTISPECIES: hypothetical protein [Sorangium]|uniref:Uncharacterized protein n=1 Tax=Sorangium cellulosum TaxID=56 RepID=A0A4P2QYV3_SORCE|nr:MULTISPECIES: hypothetical protein [Sorangium]AUX35488.1 uncharacterized protein SOCE836_076810 [Sorangium cellulosum]WCQ94789.1 hypothetical protein NQZ70_07559 [Sorangium sp. Soce836]